MKRKQHSKDFKAKVALEALKGQKTSNEIASEFDGCYVSGYLRGIVPWAGRRQDDQIALMETINWSAGGVKEES